MKYISIGLEVGGGMLFSKENEVRVKNLKHVNSFVIEEGYSDSLISCFDVSFPINVDCFIFRKKVTEHINDTVVEVEVTHYQNGVADKLIDFAGYAGEDDTVETVGKYEALKERLPYVVW